MGPNQVWPTCSRRSFPPPSSSPSSGVNDFKHVEKTGKITGGVQLLAKAS